MWELLKLAIAFSLFGGGGGDGLALNNSTDLNMVITQSFFTSINK